MRIKIVSALALSSLLAATISFAADDAIGSPPTGTNPVTDANMNAASPTNSNNDISGTNMGSATNTTQAPIDTSPSTPNTTTNEDISADTATGDDDY